MGKDRSAFIIPTLSVSNAIGAIDFYKRAFGARVLGGNTDPDGATVAELSIEGAHIVVADASPAHGNFTPEALGGISVRIGLMVADPDTFAARAVAEGIETVYPVADQPYGYRLGHFIDPYGHHWEIGKPL
ncbi:VOC family protein [Mucilaginibacter sp. AK015]|uniref:VOC family protein n=1 Tax=Mucilaginibacter sp. AK015 TaxID=2723072 RepID=UPI0016108168|nr:VOC family protein [Mucilaginibacter sp. AK015]MBB5394213.1 PhnB protein [Mucilaginibacter sp. AK015]